MAAADLRDKLSCSLCREIYTDPVTLPCGHSYCLRCIEGKWGEQGERRVILPCPECGCRFIDRPELKKNVTLSDIAEQFSVTPPGQTGARNICPNSEAAQSTLSEPTISFIIRNCHIHKKMLEYHCCDDGAFICSSCLQIGTHRGHRVELLSEASEKKKEKLREVLLELSPEREEIKKRIQRLQERLRELPGKAAGETERVTALFRGIREELEALEKRLLRDISREQEKVSLQLTELIHQLEIKKDELSIKIRHIEELCNMAAPFPVLQAREPDGAEGGENKHRKMKDIYDPAIGDLDMGLISESLLTGLDDIVFRFKGKRFPGQEATDLVLDKNTAGNNVHVSDNRKTAFHISIKDYYPQTRKRIQVPQALSTRSFPSGRHYWDVEGSESGAWRVGVAYPSIKRAKEQSRIGDNKMSWHLNLCNNKYDVGHNGKSTELPHVPSCRRIRISLDYEAGRLSFYELSEPIRHLHTFSASFTEPLHAAFWVDKSSIRIISQDFAIIGKAQ